MSYTYVVVFTCPDDYRPLQDFDSFTRVLRTLGTITEASGVPIERRVWFLKTPWYSGGNPEDLYVTTVSEAFQFESGKAARVAARKALDKLPHFRFEVILADIAYRKYPDNST